MAYRINCFTQLPESAVGEDLKKKVHEHFVEFGPINDCGSGWRITKPHGTSSYSCRAYYNVEYSDESSYQKALISGPLELEGYRPMNIISSISTPHKKIPGGQTSSPSPAKRSRPDSPSLPRTLIQLNSNLSNSSDTDIRFLYNLRQYGLNEKKKLLEKGKRAWKEFCVILVLPAEEYEIFKIDESLPVDILKKYGKVAVPTSYSQMVDHPEEQDRKVLHAEAKLMGDPLRDPPKLSVPYDRSWLMRIITEHQLNQWQKEDKDPTTKYKLFLYSENEICINCVKLIQRSIFVNMVRKLCGDDIKPVIGHSFEKIVSAEELVTEEKSKILFIYPKKVTEKKYAYPKVSSENGFESVKRDIVEDMAKVSDHSTSQEENELTAKRIIS